MHDYVDEVMKIVKNDKIILPKYDFYKWKNSNRKHFFELQNNNKVSMKKRTKELKLLKKKRITPSNKITLLDTSIGSDNVGDNIIMNYCENICINTIKDKELINLPTHIYDERLENMINDIKILCGTNIIYKKMEESKQWVMPINISNLKNTCLLGVGLQKQDIDQPMSKYTELFFKSILADGYYHSVRDEDTKIALESIGIKNVLNTSCPTMWNLSKEHCKTIPVKKANFVLTTITDYEKDYDNDRMMLNILKENYDEVYVWIQGQYDYEYLNELVNIENYNLVPPSLDELDRILEMNDLDYVGTRLHAGIRSLNFKHRSLVIAIDNRARSISADTNLPIMERTNIKNDLIKWIKTDNVTDIHLPEEKINLWKNQFKK